MTVDIQLQENAEYGFEDFVADIQALNDLNDLRELLQMTTDGIRLNQAQKTLKQNPEDTASLLSLARHYFSDIKTLPESFRNLIVDNSPEPQRSWLRSWIDDGEEGFKFYSAIREEFLKALPENFTEKYDEHYAQSLQIQSTIETRIAELS